MLKLLYFIGRARREELQHLAWYSDVRVQSLQKRFLVSVQSMGN